MPSRRTLAYLLINLIVLTAAAVSANAQGVIIPRPCERCPQEEGRRPVQLPRALPIKSIKLDTKLAGQVATTHVEQVFRNDTDATLEGIYFFPIPETASVSEFAIWDGGRRLVGEVRSREEARRIYDEIVRRQRDPGLLEYAGPNLFQASIFPIPPRSDKKLELTYTQVLRAQSGTVSYRYPLGTGHNLTTIGAVVGRVEIEGRQPLRNIYSPSHAIEVRPAREDTRANIIFETSGKGGQQDFQLFYTLSNDDFGLTLLTHREPGKDGYFLLMLSPKDNWAETEYAAKDIVFVLDTSGSMAAEGKMEKARAALLFGVQALRDVDRFNIISFAGEERLMESGLIQADARGRARGAEFVERLRPTGGTNIDSAVVAALRQFETNDRPKIMIFMTDGLPTVGVTDPARIIENAQNAKRANVRLFTFGVGYDVNTALLDKLAAENGGVADYVEPKEDLEVKVSGFFAKVNYPVLTGLALEMGGVETDLIYPRELPDLFRGGQLTLIGRYRNPNDLRGVRLLLTGRAGRETKSFAYENLRFPLTEDNHDFLPRLWATRRVGWLMEQIRTNGEAQELRDEIVDLGTRYGIVTTYTSYLALEPGARFEGAADDAITITRPGDGSGSGRERSDLKLKGRAPSGTRGEEAKQTAGGRTSMPSSAPAAAPPPPAKTGAIAVRESKRAREQQESVQVLKDEEASSAIRHIGGKTFYLREGDVWADSEFKPDARLPETSLVFGSEEYFALLKREPRLAEYFALGERVVVVHQGRVYRVTAAKN